MSRAIAGSFIENLESAAKKGSHDLDNLLHHLEHLAGGVSRHRTGWVDSRANDDVDKAGRSGLTCRPVFVRATYATHVAHRSSAQLNSKRQCYSEIHRLSLF